MALQYREYQSCYFFLNRRCYWQLINYFYYNCLNMEYAFSNIEFGFIGLVKITLWYEN